MSFNRLRAENQLFFLGTGQIFGLQDISINNQFGVFPLKYIGIGNKSLNQTVNSQQYADLNLNSLLIQEDILIQQTGAQPINCFILKTQNDINSAYSLISGYLTNYSAKYVPNQIPQINSTFRFYNNAGYINTGNLDNYSFSQLSGISTNTYQLFNNDIADSNYINLTLNEYNTNRVLDYSFSININRLPIYNIGNRTATRVDIIYPINVICNITFEADTNFSGIVLNNFPSNKIVQDISLDVFSNRTNTLMENYSFRNMTLVSENSSSNIDGNLTISRQYLGQIFNIIDDIIPLSLWDFGFIISGVNFSIDWGYTNSGVISGYDFGAI